MIAAGDIAFANRLVVPARRRTAITVGVAGFEPTASSSRTKRATKLRHTPLEASTAYRTGTPPDETAGYGLVS